MGALRTKMIEEMKLRNFSPRTEQSYVSAMVGLVKHYRHPPDQLTQEQIRSYLLHLKERGLAPSSRNVAISGMNWFIAPPRCRIINWLPRQMPNIGIRRRSTSGHSKSSSPNTRHIACS